MADWNPEANELFLKASELAAGGQRDAFLDEACDGDTALKARVIQLLVAEEAAGRRELMNVVLASAKQK